MRHPNPVDESKTLFDFHSFLSDDKQQMASTADNHMQKLIALLKKDSILCEGGRILGSTDGCAKQCECSSALRFISLLAHKERIAIDRAVGAPGHGKCEVDAINGVDKNTIYREAMKTVHDPEKVFATKSKLLQAFSVNNVKGEKQYSAAANRKHVLERNCAEGVKSEGERAKRERERERCQQETLACERLEGGAE